MKRTLKMMSECTKGSFISMKEKRAPSAHMALRHLPRTSLHRTSWLSVRMDDTTLEELTSCSPSRTHFHKQTSGSRKATRLSMKTGIGALVAGIVGVIGVLLFLVAFGTEYWLLATEACGDFASKNGTLDTEREGVSRDSSRSVLTFHHEGFFWRCWFSGEGTHGNVWKYWFTNQPRTKHCRPGYLFPMPIALGPLPHPSYDATAVYRGFWTVFIVLGITTSLVGVFLLVCGAPFVNARLYKFGGIFLITSGGFFLLLLILFVLWKECAADFQKYILLEMSEKCIPENAPVNVHYGWSFIFAAAGTPLVYLSGLLFYLIGQRNMKVPK